MRMPAILHKAIVATNLWYHAVKYLILKATSLSSQQAAHAKTGQRIDSLTKLVFATSIQSSRRPNLYRSDGQELLV